MDERNFPSRATQLAETCDELRLPRPIIHVIGVKYCTVSLAQIERATVSFADTFANVSLVLLSVIKLEYSSLVYFLIRIRISVD